MGRSTGSSSPALSCALGLGGGEFDAADQLLTLVYPNPLQPERLVGLYIGATARSFASVQRRVEFGQADFTVWHGDKPDVVAEGTFSIDWQPLWP